MDTDVHHPAHWASRYLAELAASPKQSGHGGARTGLRELLRRHGNPQSRVRCVRVAGSKGKGSTALVMESILERAGYRTGVFTSPHLLDWSERVRIGGRDIACGALTRWLQQLDPDLRALRDAARWQGPDFFEVCLVIALLAFAEARVDWALIECGIGGDGDATAVCQASMALITSIEREHADIIGPEVIDIAREKCGIIRPGLTVVAGSLPPAARGVLHAATQANEAALYECGDAFGINHLIHNGAPVLHYQDELGTLVLPVHDALAWLAGNVAVAVAAVRHLPATPVDDVGIIEALSALQLPGRLETFPGPPHWLVDSAHTQASSALLARALSARRPAFCCLVLACSKGHEPGNWAPALWQLANHVIVTRMPTQRAVSAETVAAALRPLCPAPITIEDDPGRALCLACTLTPRRGLICATGSVYLAGFARRFALRTGDAHRPQWTPGLPG